MATDYDYTADPADELNNFTMGRAALAKSAEEIEREAAEREFRDIEPGEHILFVAGFVKKKQPSGPPIFQPDLKPREAYVDGQKRYYSTFSIGVRLAKVDDPQAQVTEWFDLLPGNATDDQAEAYVYGSKGPDGKNAGFLAGKLFQFLGRLNPDWHVEPGQDLPDEALAPKNWLNRRVIAEIVPGKAEIDPATQMPKTNPANGLPFPVRNQIKLFSFRTVAEGAAAPANRPAPRVDRGQAARPAAPAATAAPAAARPGLRRSI